MPRRLMLDKEDMANEEVSNSDAETGRVRNAPKKKQNNVGGDQR